MWRRHGDVCLLLYLGCINPGEYFRLTRVKNRMRQPLVATRELVESWGFSFADVLWNHNHWAAEKFHVPNELHHYGTAA